MLLHTLQRPSFLKIISTNLTSKSGNMKSPWAVVEIGNLRCTKTDVKIVSSRMESFTYSQPSPRTLSVQELCNLDNSLYGEVPQPTCAQATNFMVVRERLVVKILLTPSKVLVSAQLTHSASNMEDLKLLLNSQKETGSGPQFGFFQLIKSMEHGHLQEKLT